MIRWAYAVLVWGLIAGLAPAQSDRYELGVRLKSFESLWEQQKPDVQARSVPWLQRAVRSFFSAQLGEVARSMANAHWSLKNTGEPPLELVWAESLAIEPEARLVDSKTRSLVVRVRAYFDAKQAIPAGARIRLTLVGPPNEKGQSPKSAVLTTPITELPTKLNYAIPPTWPMGDSRLNCEILVEDRLLLSRSPLIAFAEDLTSRLAALRETVKANGRPTTVATATLRDLTNILELLADRVTLEMDYPGARLLTEAEGLAAANKAGSPFYGPDRPGQFWLSVPTGPVSAVVRVQVPAKLTAEKPVPLVVALHGLGGSENLFFEGYGNGIIARMCAERSWLLVAPRASTLLTAPPVVKIVDELAKLYPVNRSQVFIVGHSMGAAQTVATIQLHPKDFRAAAALGGGGGVSKASELKNFPLFVGVGTSDFALVGARNLAKGLQKAGANQVTLKEYEGIEHMMIVPIALPDVFRFFEEHAKKN